MVSLRPPEPSELARIEELYVSTFPRIERYQFGKLLSYSDYECGFRVIDDGGFRGFIYTIASDIGFFLLYMSVDPEFRGRGYGSKVLDILKSEHPGEKIFVDVEPPKGEDAEVRARRIGFYERNGFRQNGMLVLSSKEKYILMTHGGTMDIGETLAFFRELDVLL